MKFSMSGFITALILIIFSFSLNFVVPSGDCKKDYTNSIEIRHCNELQIIASLVVIMTVIFSLFIVVTAIFSKSEEEKTESPWHTLPKGYEKPNLRGDKQ